MKLILLLAISVPSLWATEMTLDQAAKKARQEGKPLLIDFYAVWCGPCKQFKKAVHSDADIQALLGQVVLVKLDAEKGEGKVAAEQFEVRGYPTFVLTTPGLETINRWSGYEKDYFSRKFNQAIADLRPVKAKVESLKAHPENAALAASLGSYYKSQGQAEQALNYYQQAESHSTEKSYLAEMFSIHYRQWADKKHAYSLADMQGFAKLAMDKPEVSASDRVQIAANMIHFCKETQNIEKIAPYVKAGLKSLEQVGKHESGYAYYSGQFRVNEALFVTKDFTSAVQIKKSTLPQGWEAKPNAINNFAWWCFENKLNLSEAAELAQKGVDLAEPGREKANIYDTLAEIQAASGHVDQAVNSIQKAIEEAPSNKYFKKQLERFKKENAKPAS